MRNKTKILLFRLVQGNILDQEIYESQRHYYLCLQSVESLKVKELTDNGNVFINDTYQVLTWYWGWTSPLNSCKDTYPVMKAERVISQWMLLKITALLLNFNIRSLRGMDVQSVDLASSQSRLEFLTKSGKRTYKWKRKILYRLFRHVVILWEKQVS